MESGRNGDEDMLEGHSRVKIALVDELTEESIALFQARERRQDGVCWVSGRGLALLCIPNGGNMTDRISDAIGLQRRIDDRSGFLASRQVGQQLYTVHDLGAFCKVPIHLTPGHDSAYYADGTSEFTQLRSAKG